MKHSHTQTASTSIRCWEIQIQDLYVYPSLYIGRHILYRQAYPMQVPILYIARFILYRYLHSTQVPILYIVTYNLHRYLYSTQVPILFIGTYTLNRYLYSKQIPILYIGRYFLYRYLYSIQVSVAISLYIGRYAPPDFISERFLSCLRFLYLQRSSLSLSNLF